MWLASLASGRFAAAAAASRPQAISPNIIVFVVHGLTFMNVSALHPSFVFLKEDHEENEASTTTSGDKMVYLGHPIGYEHYGLFVVRNQLSA